MTSKGCRSKVQQNSHGKQSFGKKKMKNRDRPAKPKCRVCGVEKIIVQAVYPSGSSKMEWRCGCP